MARLQISAIALVVTMLLSAQAFTAAGLIPPVKAEDAASSSAPVV